MTNDILRGDVDALKSDLRSLIPQMRGFARLMTRDNALSDDLVEYTLAILICKFREGLPQNNLQLQLHRMLLESIANRGAPVGLLGPRPRISQYRNSTDPLLYLTPLLRAAIVLQLMGFKYQEIAQICDVPIGTIRSRISRGYDHLAKRVEIT